MLPELPEAKNEGDGIAFILEKEGIQSLEHPWLFNWVSSKGEILLSYTRQDPFHWLQFPSLANFRLSMDPKVITCHPLTDVHHDTLRHLLLDQTLPRFLAHEGRIMSHASAVRFEDGVLLFIGDSGSGKSTLAGNFHQAGIPLLSDDCVWVKENDNRVVAVPTYGGLRLWEDSLEALFPPEQASDPVAHYSHKKRVHLIENTGFQGSEGFPVLGMFVLPTTGQDASGEVVLERLPHREAFIAMLKQTFQLDPNDLEQVRRHVRALGRVVPRIRTFRLSMPHDYGLLPVVRQKILEAIG